MSQNSNGEGAWIFVSHSNEDMKKVREIRDLLEREGHRPLLFYLRCLENKDARLPSLLRDEIEARRWFVLCDSDNSRTSEYVQEEVRIVKSLPEKIGYYVTIDLARDLKDEQHKLIVLSKRATVFISYALSDRAIAEQIYRELVRQDYRVFYDRESIDMGMQWDRTVRTGIEDAVGRGFVLLLLSPEYPRSTSCEAERAYAFKILGSRQRNNIVPVIVKDRELVIHQLPAELKDIESSDLTDGPIGATGGALIRKINDLLYDLKKRPVA
jgi:hypothetical protein